ncbi:MAG: tetratricopeptide repeat protein, partial [Myxococcales bacterium]|nr:tetratricopeptide repeat protein [Myxococcales bacterium]
MNRALSGWASFLLCAVLVGVPADARKARPRADPAKEAAKALAEGDFEKALSRLKAALEKAADPKEVALLHLLRGQCYVALQRQEEARAAFADALAKDPEISLDPSSSSPDMIDLLEQERAKLEGELSISADQEVAVRVDGKLLGPAPLKLRLPSGPHRIEASGASGTLSQEVVVRPGRAEEVRLELASLPPPKQESPDRHPEASPGPSAPPLLASAEHDRRWTVAARVQLRPVARVSGAWTAHAGYRVHPWVTVGAGAMVTGPPAAMVPGLLLRGAWTPEWSSKLRPVVALEVPVLFSQALLT